MHDQPIAVVAGRPGPSAAAWMMALRPPGWSRPKITARHRWPWCWSDELHTRICDALRGSRPEVAMEAWEADGSVRLMMRAGSSRLLSPHEVKKSRA